MSTQFCAQLWKSDKTVFIGCSKAAEQMYLFLGQEEGDQEVTASLHSQLLSAIQNIKLLQPSLNMLEGDFSPFSRLPYLLVRLPISCF